MSEGKHISFRLDGKVDHIIRDYAKFRNMPISELIRLAIIHYIEDDLDSKYFDAAVHWERVSSRMKDALKLFDWDHIDRPDNRGVI